MQHPDDGRRRPTLRPTPVSVDAPFAIETPLTQGWSYHPAPGDGWFRPDAPTADFAAIAVPGEPAMQGFEVGFDVEAGYLLPLDIPVDLGGARVVLRFDGVYSAARVWLNGEFVGDHLGGFTRFEIDVTDAVVPGEQNLLAVGVTDRSASVSTASNYAFHPVGGIVRPVSLLVLPAEHLRRLHVETPVDEASGTATLRLALEVEGHTGGDVELVLRDPDGAILDITVAVVGDDGHVNSEIVVPRARLWSDEDPALHALELRLGSTLYLQRIGLRQVRIEGNRMLVNGSPVMLRGVNRHDLHPVLGRSSDGTLERMDLELFRAANINFVRTSHYPPHPALLDAADELGIFIEVENGVCWAGQFGWPDTQDEERFRSEYLGPLAEMIERDRNHPSVVIWSIGNESTWGANFEASFALAREADPTRPVIMSFAGGPEDIVSSHYPEYGAFLGDADRPVLHDEIAHVPVYQSGALRRDPAVHADWADSIADLLGRLHRDDGALGLAVWSGVDEQFALGSGTVGFGPWGIIDTWRRRKPEWWAMRSACSPVELDLGAAAIDEHGRLGIPVVNRHSRTDLDTVSFVFERDGGESVVLDAVALAPGEEGKLWIPSAGAVCGTLRVRRADGRVLDERWIDLSPRPASEPLAPAGGGSRVGVHERDGAIEVSAADTRVTFDPLTGLPARIGLADREALDRGLVLWVDGEICSTWDTPEVVEHGEAVRVIARGAADGVDAVVISTVLATGAVEIEAEVSGEKVAHAAEAGVRLGLVNRLDRTEWWGRAARDIAGEEYLGRPRGRALRAAEDDPRGFGEGDWRTLSSGSIDRSRADAWQRDFRAARRAVTRQVLGGAEGAELELFADGRIDTRLAPAREVIDAAAEQVGLSGEWARRPIPGGLNQGTVGLADMSCDETGATATLCFEGSAIDVVGALGPDLGIVDVRLDGAPLALGVDLFSPVHCGGHVIARADGLAAGVHELTLIVSGRRHPWSTGTSARLRGFEVFADDPGVDLVALGVRRYPVSGAFDWMPQGESSQSGDERGRAHVRFALTTPAGVSSSRSAVDAVTYSD